MIDGLDWPERFDYNYVNPHGGQAIEHPRKPLASQFKKRAYVQETTLAKAQTAAGMPAKRVPLSGALKKVGLDGDVDVAWYLAECKNYTPKVVRGEKHIDFPISWLDKVMEEGKISGRPGLVVLQPKGAHNSLVVIDMHQFIGLMGRAYKAIHGEEPPK